MHSLILKCFVVLTTLAMFESTATAQFFDDAAPEFDNDGISSYKHFPVSGFGLDSVVHVPVGDLGDDVGVGFGGLVYYEARLRNHFSLTVRGGYIYHLKKEQAGQTVSLSQLPVVGGIKIYVHERVFASSEIGINYIRQTVKGLDVGIPEDSLSISGTEATANFGLGAKLGYFQLGANLSIPNLSNRTKIGIMATLGFWSAKKKRGY